MQQASPAAPLRTTRVIIHLALDGMTPLQRAGLILLASADVEGLGQGALVSRATLEQLVDRGIARRISPPADRPSAWRVVVTNAGGQLAHSALVRARAGNEDKPALELLRRAGVLPAVEP